MPTDQERDPVAIRISHKLDGLPAASISFNNCLLGVRDPLHNVDKPTSVAIGPRYRGERELQEMEKQKLKYLKQLLERLRENTVDKYVVEIRGLEQRAWEFLHLDDQTTSFSRDEFVEMLLLDGCCIIELFRRYKNKDKQQEEDHDLIMAKDEVQASLRRELRRDLILLDNQIPFFIIDHLFKKTRLRSEHNDDIIRLALGFLKWVVPNQRLEVVNNGTEVKHLLGLVHHSWGCQFIRALNNNRPGDADKKWGFVDSATELQEAGVEFQMVKTTNLFDVQFNSGIMEIPRLTIKEYTEFPFRNIVLYEQRHLQADQRKYVSDYMAFINCLVNSPRDVQLLRHRNIIESSIANDTTVYNMLKDLSRLVQISSENFCYFQVCLDVNRHCRQRKNAWIAKLKFAAFLLLFLTIVQTLFSVLAYFKGS
ncbi:UPF0481 protein At3g47200-like [Diospyros lotus]|uniref:UPF0481 protein At3g47200-like n=1 Tax=Diospyros lotus TaxID=55363 RepID=UPI0022539862|nr:UPF0481 protein At3g47200-like [Diospyros lotus]XP_052195364.1 UPF0481 protein At3g47200-like [Diospyros lotus]